MTVVTILATILATMLVPSNMVWAQESITPTSITPTSAASTSAASTSTVHTIAVHVTATPANVFIPSRTFGAALDGMQQGDVARVYTPSNVTAMNSAGFVPITYRLRTELGVEAWHWNPHGTWSDPAHAQGYWTSADSSSEPISVSYGYRLPRRGNTIDQANDDGYSRLDDGDLRTFWKSNPYLDEPVGGTPTHAPRSHASSHALPSPQWVVIDFRARTAVNAIRIRWADPYATRFLVQWWEQADPTEKSTGDRIPGGHWHTFTRGQIDHARGGDGVLRLASEPVHTHLLRILMTDASHTAPSGTRDARDSAGVAIREISAGVLDAHGTLHDAVRHGAAADRQTVTYASSTDPWHRAIDQDWNVEQPGFDRVFHSGLTHARPVMIPVGVLYDTPENAAAELRFLRRRGYAVERIEMGEEPDGQGITPEDYAALYLRFADALHRVDASVALGGPSFQDAMAETSLWPDQSEDRAWMRRFLNVLRARARLSDFAFFSFEWYAYDDVCSPSAPQLAHEPIKLQAAMDTLHREGVPSTIPWLLAEYGYSAFAGRAEVEMAGAQLNADIVGQFLELGGTETYLYGLEPTSIMRNEHCDSWGNNMILMADDTGAVHAPVAAYYGATLLTQQWAQPGDGAHRMYHADTDIRNRAGEPLVTAYAVQRPDAQWSVMVLNKDPNHPWRVRVVFDGDTMAVSHARGFTGTPAQLDLYQYSSAQYVWHAAGEHGYASPNDPPAHWRVRETNPVIVLPPSSLTVVRGWTNWTRLD